MPDRRLAVRIDGRPVVVRLTEGQLAEVTRYAGLASVSRSEWVRETLDAARQDRTHEQAAADAGLDLTTWVRVLVLERAAETDLREQLTNAYLPRMAEPRTRRR